MDIDKLLKLMGDDTKEIEAKLESIQIRVEAIEEPQDIERVPKSLRQVAALTLELSGFLSDLADRIEAKIGK